MIHVATQDSSADAEQTLTLARGNKKRMFLRHLSVTTSGGDIASDTGIYVKDNDVTVWKQVLRSAKVFGAEWDFGKGMPIRNGDMKITVDDAGSSVVTSIAAIYEVV